MNWRFINTGFNSGNYNMAYDMRLAELCKPDEAVLRLYRWKPYCISLGAGQGFDAINSGKAAADNIGIVKRPTGGRAVLHAEELTYSVIMPVHSGDSAKKIYADINNALSEGLTLYNNRLSSIELESSQPDFRALYKKQFSAACFAVPAKSELKFDGRKLVGSAQRKLGSKILQHGSILCGGFHKKIVDYLKVDIENYNEIINLLDKTADLFSITGQSVDYELLAASLASGFESYYNMKFNDISDTVHLSMPELI